MNIPESFWAHVPGWMWPLFMATALAFFIYQAVKASETVAQAFGRLGRHIHERAIAPRRTLKRIEHIEQLLTQTSDKLDCATTYLVMDAEYHHESDILIAEKCPGIIRLMPPRVSYTEFSHRWKEGWRP